MDSSARGTSTTVPLRNILGATQPSRARRFAAALWSWRGWIAASAVIGAGLVVLWQLLFSGAAGGSLWMGQPLPPVTSSPGSAPEDSALLPGGANASSPAPPSTATPEGSSDPGETPEDEASDDSSGSDHDDGDDQSGSDDTSDDSSGSGSDDTSDDSSGSGSDDNSGSGSDDNSGSGSSGSGSGSGSGSSGSGSDDSSGSGSDQSSGSGGSSHGGSDHH